jgi:hypothetical protein
MEECEYAIHHHDNGFPFPPTFTTSCGNNVDWIGLLSNYHNCFWCSKKIKLIEEGKPNA